MTNNNKPQTELENVETPDQGSISTDNPVSWLERYNVLYNDFPICFFSLDEKGNIIEFNNACPTLLEREDLKDVSFASFVFSGSLNTYQDFLAQTTQTCEITLLIDDAKKYVRLSGQVQNKNRSLSFAMVDITDLKKREIKRELFWEIISRVNTSVNLKKSIRELIPLLKDWSECAAVGIRFGSGNDYPYFQTCGFSEKFIRKENRLCSYKADGSMRLDCICGAIIRGKSSKGSSLFNERGSFCANNTDDMLSDRYIANIKTVRNNCNHYGYKSLALIPLTYGREIFGLLQFNDFETGKFNPEIISDFEKLADCIASALMRQKAEESMHESERKWAATLSSIGDAVISTDIEGNITFLNPSAEEITGWSMTEAQHKPVMEIFSMVAEDTRTPYENPVERIIRDKIALELANHTILINRQGKEIPINYCGTPIRNDEGKITGSVLIIRDITERKKVEAELREKEVQYRNLADSGMALIWASGTDKLCNYFNKAWLKFRGRSYEQEYGTGWAEGVHPDDFDYCLGIYISSFDSRVEFDMEYRLMNAGGEYRWIRDLGTPLYNSIGEFTGYIGHCFDITEQKKNTQALKESEERFRLLFDYSMDAVLLTVPDGHILKANRSACNMFGRSEEALRYLDRHKIVDESDPRLAIALNQRLKTGSFSGELTGLRSDGSRFPIELSSVLFHDSEGNLRSSMIIKDITERKKFEEELIKAKEKAEESDRLKSAFLANMSHEIRTPMNGILGFAELLKQPRLSGEEQEEYINIIQKSGERMLNIINDIISISRIESGQMRIINSRVNLNETIDYIFSFFKPETDQKEIDFSCKKQSQENLTFIWSDKEKISAVLINLVKNAIKFTPKGGKIEFGYEIKDAQCHFFVFDSGIGIPPDQVEVIFDRFRQVNDSSTRLYEGAGLGLAISKAYVEMLGGKIWVESKYQIGSSFFFTIPVSSNITNSSESESIDSLSLKKKLKILIVEDDELSMVLLSKSIKDYSRELLKVRDGIDAVETFRKNSDIDLILMDIQLPGISGLEATRQIRKINKEVIIFAQTALAFAEDSVKSLEAGCNDHISKPIKKSVLEKMLIKYFT